MVFGGKNCLQRQCVHQSCFSSLNGNVIISDNSVTVSEEPTDIIEKPSTPTYVRFGSISSRITRGPGSVDSTRSSIDTERPPMNGQSNGIIVTTKVETASSMTQPNQEADRGTVNEASNATVSDNEHGSHIPDANHEARCSFCQQQPMKLTMAQKNHLQGA